MTAPTLSESTRTPMEWLRGWGSTLSAALTLMLGLYMFLGAPTPSQLNQTQQTQNIRLVRLEVAIEQMRSVLPRVALLESNGKVRDAQMKAVSQKVEQIYRKLDVIQRMLGQINRQMGALSAHKKSPP